jgi:hypothetical protein
MITAVCREKKMMDLTGREEVDTNDEDMVGTLGECMDMEDDISDDKDDNILLTTETCFRSTQETVWTREGIIRFFI